MNGRYLVWFATKPDWLNKSMNYYPILLNFLVFYCTFIDP
jgi:hypothetical protein